MTSYGVTELRSYGESYGDSESYGDRVTVTVYFTPKLPTVDQASSSSPCFCTIASNFRAIPLGRLAPVSHFSTVDSLVLR